MGQEEGAGEAREARAHSDDLLSRLSRNVTVLGSIIAGLVAINTTMTTCSNDTVARYETFRGAVDGEEQFWRDRFNDYLGVFAKGIEGQERRAKLFALSALAQREIPNFAEYRLGLFDDPEAKRLAMRRLEELRSRLNQALDREQSSDPELVQYRADLRFAAAEASRVQSRRDGAVVEAPAGDPEPIAPTPAAASGVNYQTQLLSRGDGGGWDMDVFWCSGGGPEAEAQNYGSGLESARVLAARSEAGERIAGERLGRVRLVTLPEARQAGTYPARGAGNQVRASTDEIAFASGVLAAINTPPRGYRLVRDAARTRWYVSIFACAAGGPARPVRPAAVPAEAVRAATGPATP